jgi:hypothetical protein
MTNFPLRYKARIPREAKFYDPLAGAARSWCAASEGAGAALRHQKETSS